MSTRNSEYLEAINHLPDGAMLVFQQLTWKQYEKLLDDLEDHAGLRVSYDDGKLEIMSPLPEHEYYKDFILVAVRLFAQEHDIELETFGSATWKRRKLRKGAEPDTCFYVTNARAVIGKRKIDLETDPPPDVVVEIDTTSQSLSKFSIYAAFGVPEIWRYDGERITMYKLVGETYVEGDHSRFFPNLNVELLTQSLEVSKTEGQTAALAAFRQRTKSA